MRSIQRAGVLVSLAFLSLSIVSTARSANFAADDTQAMAAAHEHDKPVATPAAAMEPRVEVEGRDVVYLIVGAQKIQGYLARPKGSTGSLPGLIVIHEWWGLNDNIRAMTRRLAGEGYTALAVDLYGGKTATDPGAATKLMQATNENSTDGIANLGAAASWLKQQEKAPQIGVIGWCFGGGWALQAALSLPSEIHATVMYYGRVVTDVERLKRLQAPLLGLFGAADQAIAPADVRTFEKALKSAGAEAEIKIYDGAGHAFANPSGTSYRPDAAADAWKRATEFLAKHLKS